MNTISVSYTRTTQHFDGQFSKWSFVGQMPFEFLSPLIRDQPAIHVNALKNGPLYFVAWCLDWHLFRFVWLICVAVSLMLFWIVLRLVVRFMLVMMINPNVINPWLPRVMLCSPWCCIVVIYWLESRGWSCQQFAYLLSMVVCLFTKHGHFGVIIALFVWTYFWAMLKFWAVLKCKGHLYS